MLIKETWGNYLRNKFTENIDRMAIVDISKNRRYTYRDLMSEVERIEKALISYGVTRGTHVALILPSNGIWMTHFLALIDIGAVPVCFNNESTEVEIRDRLIHSDSRLVITDEENYTKISVYQEAIGLDLVVITDRQSFSSEAVDCSWNTFIEKGNEITRLDITRARDKVRYDDILAIQYTSGTTGTPKAVRSVHYKVLSNIKLFSDIYKYTKEDKVLSSLPMYHVMGCFFTGFATFMAGGCFVMVDKFKTNYVIDILIEEKCTSFHGVPTMYKLIMNKMGDRRFESLNKGMIGGMYCDVATMEAIMTKMGIKNIFALYGQSEGCGYTQTTMEDTLEKVKTTVGRPGHGIEIKIVDEHLNELPVQTDGEILIKSDYFMDGYYKDEAATNKTIVDNWMYTGDLGQVDQNGYLKITGRKKDLIIRGGENISPVEIELFLKAHTTVKDAVIVGVPDEIMGQEIGAFIIVDDKEKRLKEEVLNDIKSYMTKHLPRYKRPKYIKFVKAFPITGSGKIQKFKLIELIVHNRIEE